MYSDVRLAASFPEKRFASKVSPALGTEVPDFRPKSGRLIIFQNSRNGCHECVAARSQFVQPVGDDPLQSTLASGKQNYGNSPLVAPAAVAAYIAVCLKTID